MCRVCSKMPKNGFWKGLSVTNFARVRANMHSFPSFLFNRSLFFSCILFSPQVNGLKRPRDDDDVIEQPPVQKTRVEREVIIIDDSSPPPEEKKFEPEISHELTLDGIDSDLIIKLGKLSQQQQWIKLAKSAQQLRNLRENVCKLLRVLVPEIELGDKAEILDDTTVDNLLKQVLEANIQPDQTNS